MLKSRVAPVAALVAVVGAAIAPSGAGGEAGHDSAGPGMTMERGGLGSIRAFKIGATMQTDSLVATRSDSGRFILKSRDQALTPIDPPGGCRVDSSKLVSCDDGRVRALIVRLKGGADTFVARPRLRIATLVVGGGQPDRIVGGNGPDELRGRLGGDRLVGRRGDDKVIGGAGRDVLDGGAGNDRVNGGPGDDFVASR
jgi:RTX calcium-binding nonapeptide repeat (4 copies)